MSTNKILIIDDSPLASKIIEAAITIENAIISFARNGKEALEMVDKFEYDVLLLDVVLPDIEGFEVCKIIKAKPSVAEIPVIFITSLGDDETIKKCFHCGGVDYIQKPLRAVELNARLKTHIDLYTITKQLKHISRTDFLTKLFNRTHMKDSIQRELSRAERDGSVFSMVICDIDHFKVVNDTYGHNMGDYILKAAAAIMQTASRKSDIISRWGGEEFLLLLPNTDIEHAETFAEHMRKRIEEYVFTYEGSSLSITFTFGVGEYDITKTEEENIANIDKALYIGKNNGRNQVVRA